MRIQIGHQHLSRTETATVDDPLRIKVHQTRFRTGNDQRIFGEEEAAGTQAIAIQGHADQVAIGKGQRRRAVPGLDAIGVVAKKGRLLLAAGRRQQHSDRFCDTAAVAGEQLDDFVEAGRIRAILGKDGVTFRGNGSRPGIHAAPIAPDGIDLPVVSQGAQRLRPVPRGQNVGGVALVEDGKGRGISRIRQIGIKLGQQPPGTHGLVDHGGGRQRADIAGASASRSNCLRARYRRRSKCSGSPAVTSTWRITGMLESAISPRTSSRVGTTRHAEHVQILRGQGLFQRLLAGTGFAGKKDHTHGQRLAGVERKPGRGEQKLPRDRGHDAHPVAALAVGGNGSAMRQTSQRGERLGQDFMGGLVAQRGHETDTAGVVVKARIEQVGGKAALQRI